MPTASARLAISLRGEIVPSSPSDGSVGATLENASGGARWTNGQASGQVDHVYRADGVLAASATDNYNVIVAGGLKDILGGVINLKQLKGLVLTCLTGSIKLVAPAANALSIFGAATDFLNLTAGQTLALDLGPLGITVSTNGKFDITDTAGGAGSTYSLMFIGSN